MAEHGGARKGAGRKPGVANKTTKEIRAILDDRVDFEGLVDKLIELVDGVEVSERRGDEEIIYTTKPDIQAAKALLEFRFGKPSQSVDVTTKGEAINQQIIINPVAAVQLSKTEAEVDTTKAIPELPAPPVTAPPKE